MMNFRGHTQSRSPALSPSIIAGPDPAITTGDSTLRDALGKPGMMNFRGHTQSRGPALSLTIIAGPDPAITAGDSASRDARLKCLARGHT